MKHVARIRNAEQNIISADPNRAEFKSNHRKVVRLFSEKSLMFLMSELSLHYTNVTDIVVTSAQPSLRSSCLDLMF